MTSAEKLYVSDENVHVMISPELTLAVVEEIDPCGVQ